jgi:ketosteroid isomerase-like protein
LSDEVDLLRRLYDYFNARDIEHILAILHEDAVWANSA